MYQSEILVRLIKEFESLGAINILKKIDFPFSNKSVFMRRNKYEQIE